MENCIHCNLCRKNCLFLEKYKMDLAGFAERPELAYHCFLCGKCAEVCPKGIDGRRIALEMRQKQTEQQGQKNSDPAYKAILWEKNPYKFANYRHAGKKSVLFTGCNFPSFYPKTTAELVRIFAEHDIGVLYECCGKPIAELGLLADSKGQAEALDRKLCEMGVEELVFLCPNCYYYLRGKLHVRMTSVYEKLQELNIGKRLAGGLPFYYPCPDRAEKIFLKGIRSFLESEERNAFPKLQCCGLGGMAAVKETELSRAMTKTVKTSGEKELYTYCASCVSNFRRNGFAQAHHVLAEILGVEENVPLGITPIMHRALCKWK